MEKILETAFQNLCKLLNIRIGEILFPESAVGLSHRRAISEKGDPANRSVEPDLFSDDIYRQIALPGLAEIVQTEKRVTDTLPDQSTEISKESDENRNSGICHRGKGDCNYSGTFWRCS